MCDNGMDRNELNRLCKHMTKVRNSQPSISLNNSSELSKTQLFALSIVNIKIQKYKNIKILLYQKRLNRIKTDKI